MLARGLFDLQVNGFAGIDFNTTQITRDALDHALHAMWQDGVTHCLPTIITAPLDLLADRLAALDHAVATSRLGETMVPGYHLEGPFLSPRRKATPAATRPRRCWPPTPRWSSGSKHRCAAPSCC